MFQYRLKCGHCSNDVHFNVIELIEYRQVDGGIDQIHLVDEIFKRHRKQLPLNSHWKFKAYGTCPQCYEPSLVFFSAKDNAITSILKFANEERGMHSHNLVTRLVHHGQIPEAPKPLIEEAYPEEVKEIFASAQQMLQRNDPPAIIVSTCRSVLEVAMKELGAEGKNIFKKIDDLTAKGILTKSLSAWAHQVRLDGNAAIHEIKADEDQARELVNFLKIFLEVTYVLPRRIEDKALKAD